MTCPGTTGVRRPWRPPNEFSHGCPGGGAEWTSRGLRPGGSRSCRQSRPGRGRCCHPTAHPGGHSRPQEPVEPRSGNRWITWRPVRHWGPALIVQLRQIPNFRAFSAAAVMARSIPAGRWRSDQMLPRKALSIRRLHVLAAPDLASNLFNCLAQSTSTRANTRAGLMAHGG
jgi:hypothetical protein